MTGTRDYTAFGAITSASGAGLDRFRFTGREWDAAIELQYSRARVYDPDTGRFLSDDPLSFAAGDVNLGHYVGNNATGATDTAHRLFQKPLFETMVRSGDSPPLADELRWIGEIRCLDPHPARFALADGDRVCYKT